MPLNAIEMSFAPFDDGDGGPITRTWRCCVATLLGGDAAARGTMPRSRDMSRDMDQDWALRPPARNATQESLTRSA